MNIVTHAEARFRQLGLATSIVGDEVFVQTIGKQIKIKFDQEWEDAFNQYKSSRTSRFDPTSRTLQVNSSIEIQLQILFQSVGLNIESYHFEDMKQNSLEVRQSSIQFQLALFDSTEYDEYFTTRYKNRILNSSLSSRRFSQLIPSPITATYTHKGRKIPADLEAVAVEATKRCLFRLAVEYGDSLVIYKPRKWAIGNSSAQVTIPPVIEMPKAKYDEDVVNYYKVAKSSPFPSQSFLAYYHVIEYYFHRVKEIKLHARLAGIINSPTFHSASDRLEKVIATVRGQDARSDELEMLRSVLDRFVDESELISFLNETEQKYGDKRYTKKRTLFGEDCQISTQKDHALANTAKVIKHIRNAIVHSGDRYNRDDGAIPLTDSEQSLEDFLPLVRFLAEKVIYGNAE